MARANMILEVRIVNGRSLDEFHEAIELVETAAEELPWRQDLAEAARLLAAAADGLRPEQVRSSCG